MFVEYIAKSYSAVVCVDCSESIPRAIPALLEFIGHPVLLLLSFLSFSIYFNLFFHFFLAWVIKMSENPECKKSGSVVNFSSRNN